MEKRKNVFFFQFFPVIPSFLFTSMSTLHIHSVHPVHCVLMSIVAESYTSVFRYCSRHKSCYVLPTRARIKCCHTTFILCQWHQHLMGSRKLIKRWSHGCSKLQLHMGYIKLKYSKANWIRQLVSKRQYSWNAQFQRRAFAWSCYLKNHFRGTIYVHIRTLLRAYM